MEQERPGLDETPSLAIEEGVPPVCPRCVVENHEGLSPPARTGSIAPWMPLLH
jgi:hypothetical protein